MRLVTWNARRGQFAQKVSLLAPLGADVAVLQEVAKPSKETSQILWFGDNPNQGIAVVAKGPYCLRRLPQVPEVPKYFIPVSVEGPRSFVLFAVWTLGRQLMPYVQAASTAIDTYAGMFDATPVVLLGDFNSNAIWNKEHPAALNHEAMVGRLRRFGLVSAYHQHRGIEHGAEPISDHTFNLYGHEDKSYHIDYCFLPKSWADQIDQVLVGEFAQWHEHSDHRPLIVSLGNQI